MRTGMLIVNYNDYPSTKKLLDNIRPFHIFDMVVVVDNRSTDDSLKKLKRLKIPNFSVLEMKDNLGYSAAINHGSNYLIKKLGECNIIVSNPDILITKEKDIQALLSVLKNKKVGAVGPTILEHGNLNRGWKNPSPLLDSVLNLPFLHRFIRKKKTMYPSSHYNEDISKVDVISGCFFCISSKALEKINYLDENVFLYYEENILSKKLEQVGLSCFVDNRTLIAHNHSVTIDKSMKKIKKYQAQKKSQYYFQVNYQHANTFERFCLKSSRFITEIILSIYYFILDLFQ